MLFNEGTILFDKRLFEQTRVQKQLGNPFIIGHNLQLAKYAWVVFSEKTINN